MSLHGWTFSAGSGNPSRETELKNDATGSWSFPLSGEELRVDRVELESESDGEASRG